MPRPEIEPTAEGAPSGDVRRETSVMGMPEGEPTQPGEIPPDHSRTEETLLAEEVPSDTLPQAPPGDVQSDPSPGDVPPTGGQAQRAEERSEREEREEDKGLIDRARDYLRGEGRESDYLRGGDRERRER